MAPANRQGYSAVQILLHWTIALLVLFQLIFGESMGEVTEALEHGAVPDPTEQLLADAHYWVGIAILVLVGLRLLVRLFQGTPAPIGQGLAVRAAKIVHGIFYLLLVAVPVTGLLAVYVDEEIGEVHEIGKPLFIAFIVIHALGALFHHFWLKDRTLKRMLSPAP
nr:cytochrome b/b6 domain-containing protein [uncultured Dongia sp.]